MSKRNLCALALLSLGVLLTGCGGDEEEPCVDQGSIAVKHGYVGGNTLNYVRGVAKTWPYTVEGLPPSCDSKKTFEVVTDGYFPTQPLPEGVRLDSKTGDISGVIVVDMPKTCEFLPTAPPRLNGDCILDSIAKSTTIEMSIPGFKPLTTQVWFKQVAVDPDKVAHGGTTSDEGSKARLEAE